MKQASLQQGYFTHRHGKQGGNNMLSLKGFTEEEKGRVLKTGHHLHQRLGSILTSPNTFLCSCSMKTDRHFSTLQQKKKKKKKKEEKKNRKETKHIPL
jgi:hypothetical protein